MKVIEFDGRDFKNVEYTHNILKNKLDLPEYYGNNLDALWDCITGWIEEPIRIKWKYYNESYKQLGKYAEDLKCVFEDASVELDGVVFEIEL